jgi:hypothetical protein
MKKRTATRAIIFLLTLLIFFGGIGVAGYWLLGRRSGTPGSNGVTIAAPTSLEDFFVSFYLDTRRAELTMPAGDDPKAVVFTVEPGESVTQIASRLQSEGLVRDAQLFRLYLRYSKLDSGVEAGQFTLKRTMTIPQIAQALQSGKRGDEITLTIPEGRRLEEIAALVAQQTPISATLFLSLTRRPTLGGAVSVSGRVARGRVAGGVSVPGHVSLAPGCDGLGRGRADAGEF